MVLAFLSTVKKEGTYEAQCSRPLRPSRYLPARNSAPLLLGPDSPVSPTKSQALRSICNQGHTSQATSEPWSKSSSCSNSPQLEKVKTPVPAMLQMGKLTPREVEDASQKHTVRDDGGRIQTQAVCTRLSSASLPVLSSQFESLKLWGKPR